MKRVLFTGMMVTLLLTACKSKSKDAGEADKKTTSTEKSTTSKSDDVPSIDMASLKDEASFLKAWETFTDARMADEKKQKEVSGYAGHYLEYMDIYTALLKATTAYTSTISDPSAALAFGNKVTAIQNKMYAK